MFLPLVTALSFALPRRLRWGRGCEVAGMGALCISCDLI